jgi:hypothetical protein
MAHLTTLTAMLGEPLVIVVPVPVEGGVPDPKQPSQP